MEYINPNSNHERAEADALAKTLFPLAFAVGAFHRDYADIFNAAKYFDLAGELAELAGVNSPKNKEFLQLLNHRRILAEGTGERGQAKGLTDQLLEAKYGEAKYENLHERLNILQWRGRHSSGEEDAEHWLTEIKEVTSAHFTGWPTEPKLKDGNYSAWDHGPVLCRIGEANRVLGKSSARASTDCFEAMKHASRVYREGHLGVCALEEGTRCSTTSRRNTRHETRGKERFNSTF